VTIPEVHDSITDLRAPTDGENSVERARSARSERATIRIVSDLSRHEVQLPEEVIHHDLPDLEPVHETVAVAE
jgi:hypothetical protein